MNQNETTFQDMIKNSISCLNAYEIVWKGNELMGEEVEALKKNDKEVEELAKIQNDTKAQGQSAQKKQDMQILGKLIYKLACLLRHMAIKTNNKVLLKSVDYSENKFTSGKENKVIMRFEAILVAAREYVTDLNKYNVSTTDLDAHDTLLAKIKSMPDSINVSASKRKSATRNIKDLNKEARRILALLDDLIEGMIHDEKFIDAWFEARKIKGRHRGGKKGNGAGDKDVPPTK